MRQRQTARRTWPGLLEVALDELAEVPDEGEDELRPDQQQLEELEDATYRHERTPGTQPRSGGSSPGSAR
eukprot:13276955-Heterocapsa_arctica.AAC.1